MNNNINTNGQKLIFIPDRGSNFRYMSFEYLKGLFESKEIEIPINDIKKIGQLSSLGKNSRYLLTGMYQGSEVFIGFYEANVKNPEVFKYLLENRPELFKKFNFINEIVENSPDYFKYSAISVKLILTNFVMLLSVFFLKLSFYSRIKHNQWFVNNSCDIECAKYFVGANFATVLAVLVSLLPIVISVIFFKYQLPKIKKMKKVNLYNACFIETALIGVIGLMLTCGFANSTAPKNIYTLFKYYNNGSLSQKISEIKNGSRNYSNKAPASVEIGK